MAITSPPPAPQRGDRATFSPRMDAFLRWLVALVPQLNTFLSSLTTMAVGGANTFGYSFDTSTADTDPGTGKIRLGSTTQSGAVVVRLDTQAASGGDISAFLSALQSGTSNIKGSLRMQRVNDPSAFLLFDITNIATASGYTNISVIPRASSAPAPFMQDDTLAVFFTQKGDRGDGGNTPSSDDIKNAIGTLDIGHGGTGATTASVALQNLGAKAAGTEPISTGGTGATTAAQALNNLGAYPKTGGQVNGAVTLIAGSQGAPAVGWANGSGLYQAPDGSVYMVINGVLSARFTQAGIESPKLTQTQ